MTAPGSVERQICPELVIVIATYRRDEMLRATILDLARQATLPGRVVVVDQSDPSDKLGLLAPLAALGVHGEYLFSRYRSISAARNIGLEHGAEAKIVLYLDDDVEMLSDVVAEHVGYYKNDADVVAVAGHVACEPLGEEFTRLNTFRPHGDFVPRGRGCHMSFRIDVLREIGGFNAYICNNGDETELYRRLAKAGYRITNGRRAVIKHLLSTNGGNRQVGLGSHANYARVLRDGMVRIVKDRGLAAGLLWPIKNWRTLIGLLRTSPRSWRAIPDAVRECYWAVRLARLSASRRDYIPLSVRLSTGSGVDPKRGLPVV